MSLMKSWCETIPLRGVVATAAISGLLFLVACGGDSSSGSSDDGASDSDLVAVKDKSISGVSQKGPFVTGLQSSFMNWMARPTPRRARILPAKSPRTTASSVFRT